MLHLLFSKVFNYRTLYQKLTNNLLTKKIMPCINETCVSSRLKLLLSFYLNVTCFSVLYLRGQAKDEFDQQTLKIWAAAKLRQIFVTGVHQRLIAAKTCILLFSNKARLFTHLLITKLV